MGDKTTKINKKTPLKKSELAKTFDYEGKLGIPNPYDKGKSGFKGNTKLLNANTRKKYEMVKDLLRVLDLETDLGKQGKKEKFDQGGSKSSKKKNEEYQKIFDDMMGNPLSKIDKLIKQAKELSKPKKFNQGGSNMGKKKMKNGGGITEAISNFFASGTKPVLEPGKGARPGLSVKEKEKLKRQKMFDKNTTKTNMDLNSNPYKASKKSTVKPGTVIKSNTKKPNTKKSVSSVAKKKLADVSREDMMKAGFTSFGTQSLRKYLNMKNKLGKKPTKSDFDSKKPVQKKNKILDKTFITNKRKSKVLDDTFITNKNTGITKKKSTKPRSKIQDKTFITNRKKGGAKVKMNKGGTFKGIF